MSMSDGVSMCVLEEEEEEEGGHRWMETSERGIGVQALRVTHMAGRLYEQQSAGAMMSCNGAVEHDRVGIA